MKVKFEELKVGDKFMDEHDDSTIWMKIDDVEHPNTGWGNKVAIASSLADVAGLVGSTWVNDHVHKFN